MDTMDGLSMDLERANLDKLRRVFPECFAEGKLDIDKLLGPVSYTHLTLPTNCT